MCQKGVPKAIKRVRKEYEYKKMNDTIKSNRTDRNAFWLHLKKCRKTAGSKVLAIKNKSDEMVYDVSEILEVWLGHYALLSTPKTDMSYDNENFISINKKVDDFNKIDESSIFLDVRAPIL